MGRERTGPSPELLELIYRPAARADAWSDVLDALGELFGASAEILLEGSASEAAGSRLQLTPAYGEWTGNLATSTARNRLVRASGRLTSAGPGRQPLARLGEFADVRPGGQKLLRLDGAGRVLGLPLLEQDRQLAVLTLTRSAPLEPFNAAEVARAEGLAPHLVRSAKIWARLDRGRSESELGGVLFDAFTAALFWLSASGRLLRANSAARKLLAAKDGLEVVAGRLSAGTASARFATAIAHAAQGRGGAIALPRRNGAPLAAVIIPLEAAAPWLGSSVARVLVRAASAEGTLAPAVERLCGLWGLTRQEGRLAAHLLNGLDLAEAATQMGVARETARTHLKRLMVKVGAARQAELIRLLLTATGPFR